MKITDSLLLALAVLSILASSAEAFSMTRNVAGYKSGSIISMSRSSVMADIVSGVVDAELSQSVIMPKTVKHMSIQRFAAVSLALSSCLLSFSCASIAADKGAGTITDKKYELCVSKCVFSETRPPPNGADNERILTTISRTDIIKDCRKSCAKTKQQLLLGKPKMKAGGVEQAEQ